MLRPPKHLTERISPFSKINKYVLKFWNVFVLHVHCIKKMTINENYDFKSLFESYQAYLQLKQDMLKTIWNYSPWFALP